VGQIERRLGEPGKAERAFDQSVAICQRLVNENPAEPAYRRQLAGAINDRAALDWDSRRFDEAEQRWRHAIALLEPLATQFPDISTISGPAPERRRL